VQAEDRFFRGSNQDFENQRRSVLRNPPFSRAIFFWICPSVLDDVSSGSKSEVATSDVFPDPALFVYAVLGTLVVASCAKTI
jgi:hypothetical protein